MSKVKLYIEMISNFKNELVSLTIAILLVSLIPYPVSAPATDDVWDPLIAGIRITTINPGFVLKQCTIGFPALMFKPPADYISGFVTAAHCTSSTGQSVYQPDIPRRVGHVYSRMPYYDVAFIELDIDEQIVKRVWYSMTATREIRGYLDDSSITQRVGYPVYLIGATSGRVQSVLRMLVYNDNGQLVGILMDAVGQPGDSGGFVGVYKPPSWRKPPHFKLIGIIIGNVPIDGTLYDLVIIADFMYNNLGITPWV